LPKKEHVVQLSIYGWLAAGKGWAVRQGEVIYLDMSKPRREVFELWPHELVEVYLKERIPLLEQAYQPEAPLPPLLREDDEAYWQCKNCEVRELCENLALTEGD
jgi:CRISPR/Cas system-associated exonuclease Cas4 (RecB family)